MISFACPVCAQNYTSPDSAAGKTAKCKECNEMFRVPGSAGTDWEVAPEEPPVDRPPPEPVPEPEGVTRRKPSWKAAVVLVVGLALGLVVVVLATRLKGSGDPDERAGAHPVAQTSRVDPATQAKQSFLALADRARIKLGDVKPESFPAFVQNDFGIGSGTDLTIDAELVYNSVFSVTEEVEATNSLIAPYRGTVKFTTKTEGMMRGVQRGERFDFPFSFPFWSDQQAEALYSCREGRWSLSEVKFTTTNFGVTIPDEKASVFTRLLAGEMNKSKGRMVGRAATLKSSAVVLSAQVCAVTIFSNPIDG